MPFEPLAQPLAAVNDYPAVCQYRSQVRFEGQEALDCARAGWGGSRKHQAEFLSGFPSLPESVAFLALFPSAQPAAPMTSGKVRTPGPPA